jgi:MinD-like ATPase involved in chromosome partitioning or flagellar assembly
MPLGGLRAERDGCVMGHVIAFIPASGGVGASTLSAALAVRAAAADRRVAAVDLDSLRGLGGRLDVVLGTEQHPGWRWGELAGVDGIVDGAGLARELPWSAGVAVLSGPGVPVDAWPGVVPDVVAGLARAHDVTVVDLPRDERLVRAVAGLLDALVVVVGSQVPQLAAAAVCLPGLRAVLEGGVALEGVALEGAALKGVGPRGPDGSGVLVGPVLEPWVVLRGARADAEVEDLVSDELDVPVVGFVRDDPRVLADAVDGTPPGLRGRGPVVDVADRLLLRLVAQELAA